MPQEYTPELDDSVLAALKRKIQAEENQRLSQARGSATAMGIAGSSYQGVREALANKYGMDATTDAMVNMSVERARMQREERLTQEDRTYQSGEKRLTEQYNSLEAEKQRAYAAGETEKARAFEAEQNKLNQQFQGAQMDANRATDSMNSRREARGNMMGGVGSLVGTLIQGKMFGGGAGGGGGGIGGAIGGLFGKKTIAPTPGGAGIPAAGGMSMGQLGIGALGLGARIGLESGAGQLVNKGLFGNSKAGRKGAQIGALSMIPGGGIMGAGVGAAAKGVKKIFCFDPFTTIQLADGSFKSIHAVKLGDELSGDGGIVDSIRISNSSDGTRYIYKGVVVTGYHAVKEDGKWLRIKDSVHAIPLSGEGIVVSLVTSTHRIFIDGIEFADEHETDDYETISIDESLNELNKMEELVNA